MATITSNTNDANDADGTDGTDPTRAAALARAARDLGAAARVVVFTGAGMSADSGIATFREALTGLWSRFDAHALATPAGFDADPPLVWGWYESRRQQVMRAQPNAGHLALAQLQRQRPGWQVVTQNVDDLHERAALAVGADAGNVLHLHGSLFAARCHHCGQPHALPAGRSDVPAQDSRLPPPRCSACGGPVRPGVVWFGEALPHAAWARAEAAVRGCGAMLVVGTSGVVHPAAGLPTLALSLGRPVWVVDPDAAAGGGQPLLHRLTGRAAALLPALAAALG
jgi:NAD-dependent deacetylase